MAETDYCRIGGKAEMGVCCGNDRCAICFSQIYSMIDLYHGYIRHKPHFCFLHAVIATVQLCRHSVPVFVWLWQW